MADETKQVEKQEESTLADEQQETTKANGKKKEADGKYTDEQVNEIINRKFAEWSSKKEKELDEAKKLAQMDERQKAEYERDVLKRELSELKKENTRAKMAKTAREMLSEKNIAIGDDLVSILITDEAESTKANVDQFSSLFQDAVEKAVAERLKSKTPTKMVGKGMSREEILSIPDSEKRRRAIAENLELFN